MIRVLSEGRTLNEMLGQTRRDTGKRTSGQSSGNVNVRKCTGDSHPQYSSCRRESTRALFGGDLAFRKELRTSRSAAKSERICQKADYIELLAALAESLLSETWEMCSV